MGKFGHKNEVDLNPLHYNIALLGESGIGKEQPVSEPVLTEDGWVPMGQIKVGTKVFGDDGQPHVVTGVFPQGIKDVYEITFKDGTKTRCGLEHLWTVTTKKQRENMRKNNDYRYMVLSLAEILKDYKREIQSSKGSQEGNYAYKYNVPINKPIQFQQNTRLAMNPYILGLLLGDGCFTTSVITFTNSERELLDEVAEWCKEKELETHVREYDNHYQANICIAAESDVTKNPLRECLSDLKLLGCGSREKFVPKEYLYSTIEDRARLLSGIINTDGHVHDEHIVVDTYSKQLAMDVAELARGLGFVAHLRYYDRTSENSTQKYDKELEYRVSIIGDEYSQLCLSDKHKSRLKSKATTYVKSIVDISLVGQEESQCIMVDNPNHTYITRDYIVTHNTTIAKEMCEKLVGDEGYLHLDIGRECGADAIQGIVTEPIEDWEKLTEVVDDIVENKETEYPKLQVVICDTLDELILLAEAEAIRLHNIKNPDKRADTINSAWGGFGKGQDKAIELMLNVIWELKKVGVSTLIIGHVKRSDILDPITQETYSKLTSDAQQRYFNGIKNKMHFVGLAYIDRNIVKEKTGRKNLATKEDIMKTKIISESRVISFRDDTYSVDSKSRFANIVDKVPFDVDAFIKAMTDAIEAERSKGGKTLAESQKVQKEKDKKAAEAAKQYSSDKKRNHVDENKNQELVDKIKGAYFDASDDTKEKVKEIMAEYGIMKFSDENLPTKGLEEIVSVLVA